MRHYRYHLPRLIRTLIYPDAVAFRDLNIEHHRIREDIAFTPAPIDTPDAVFLGLWREVSDAAKPVYQPPEVFSARLCNVLYWPRFNLVLTDRRAVILESTSTVLPIAMAAWTDRFFASIRDIRGICTVFRSVHNNFYHTLIDNLTRLYFLHQPPYDALPEIRLLLPSDPDPHETYLFNRYLPSNVTVTLVEDGVLWRPQEMIFPSFLTRRSLTHVPRPVLNHLLPHLLPTRPRRKRHRIFVARREGSRGRLRVIENEAELWHALKDLGFEKVHLEDLSFDDQIALFYDASIVVSPHGAGLSNMIFAETIDVLELHASPIVVPTYYYLSLSCGHRYRWWCGDRAHFDDSFSVDVDAIKQLLL